MEKKTRAKRKWQTHKHTFRGDYSGSDLKTLNQFVFEFGTVYKEGVFNMAIRFCSGDRARKSNARRGYVGFFFFCKNRYYTENIVKLFREV